MAIFGLGWMLLLYIRLQGLDAMQKSGSMLNFAKNWLNRLSWKTCIFSYENNIYQFPHYSLYMKMRMWHFTMIGIDMSNFCILILYCIKCEYEVWIFYLNIYIICSVYYYYYVISLFMKILRHKILFCFWLWALTRVKSMASVLTFPQV